MTSQSDFAARDAKADELQQILGGQAAPETDAALHAAEAAFQAGDFGTKLRGFLSAGVGFPPGANAAQKAQWAIEQFRDQPGDYVRTLYAVSGVVTEAFRKKGEYQGEPTESILLKGQFIATLFDTGELVEANVFYAPNVVGEQALTILGRRDRPPSVDLNIIVGITRAFSANSMLPYNYSVHVLGTREQQEAKRRLREQHLAVMNRMAQAMIAGPAAAKPIEHKGKSAKA